MDEGVTVQDPKQQLVEKEAELERIREKLAREVAAGKRTEERLRQEAEAALARGWEA